MELNIALHVVHESIVIILFTFAFDIMLLKSALWLTCGRSLGYTWLRARRAAEDRPALLVSARVRPEEDAQRHHVSPGVWPLRGRAGHSAAAGQGQESVAECWRTQRRTPAGQSVSACATPIPVSSRALSPQLLRRVHFRIKIKYMYWSNTFTWCVVLFVLQLKQNVLERIHSQHRKTREQCVCVETSGSDISLVYIWITCRDI